MNGTVATEVTAMIPPPDRVNNILAELMVSLPGFAPLTDPA